MHGVDFKEIKKIGLAYTIYYLWEFKTGFFVTLSRGKTTYLVDLTETLECTYCYKKYLAKNLICQQGRFFKADILFKTVNHRGKWWAHLATSKKMTHCSNIALKKRVVVHNVAKYFLKS